MQESNNINEENNEDINEVFYKIMTMREFVEYIKSYIWTQISFTPEMPEKGANLLDFIPKKNWCYIMFKNFSKESIGICLYNKYISDHKIHNEIIPGDEIIMGYFKQFFKDFYNLDCDYDTKIIVDFMFVNHNPLLSAI